jgi:NAD(P)-dependent dehydrogenase (short-subunit alcohol dehydrogenase family)
MRSTLVITGAAGALGSTLVRHFHAGGHRVAALDVPAAEARLTALAAELGPTVLGVPIDVGAAARWSAVLSLIEADLGPPDGAVLVAGGWQGGAPLHAEPDDAAWRAMINVNLETTYQSLRALLPGMVKRGAGSVVVVGSRAAEQPWTSVNASAYAAAKAAVVALAKTVAAEVLASGVRVNAVLPSIIDTPANRRAMPDADPARWVSTESLARVIDFLLFDGSKDVSGAALPVYGRA